MYEFDEWRAKNENNRRIAMTTHCCLHQSMLDNLFANKDESQEHVWTMTAYAKRVAREGRLLTPGETMNLWAVSGRRRKRRKCVVADEHELQPTAAILDGETREIERANRNPLRDVLVFAATNVRLFTIGGERSIASVYRSLWRLIYGSSSFGRGCALSDRGGSDSGRSVHVTHGSATFPWRSHGDTVSRFAYNSDRDHHHQRSSTDSTATAVVLVSIQARLLPVVVPSNAISVTAIHAFDANYKCVNPTEWRCDVTTTWSLSTTRAIHAMSTTKLLDHRFESARDAWCLLFDVMNWCERTHETLDVYPVRRSVWDLLVVTGFDNVANGSNNCETVIFSTNGLIDVGDVYAYAHTIRVLVLIIYLSCSYGGISRAACVNDRVSNRSHRCAFPTKTSGVYYALFHTSVLPHRLFCGDGGGNDDDDLLGYGGGDSNTVATNEAVCWLNRFRQLCANAAARYDIPSAYDDGGGCVK